jgi:hypothetical protein
VLLKLAQGDLATVEETVPLADDAERKPTQAGAEACLDHPGEGVLSTGGAGA